eukprot:gene28411-31551_t
MHVTARFNLAPATATVASPSTSVSAFASFSASAYTSASSFAFSQARVCHSPAVRKWQPAHCPPSVPTRAESSRHTPTLLRGRLTRVAASNQSSPLWRHYCDPSGLKHGCWARLAGDAPCSSSSRRLAGPLIRGLSTLCSASASKPEEPWALMGRVIQEESIPLGSSERRALILSAATAKSGLSEEEFDNRVKALLQLLPNIGDEMALLQLLPDIADRLLVLKPDLLIALCLATNRIAERMIKLKIMFPSANSSSMIKLKIMFPSANCSSMVSKRPDMLLDSEWPGVLEGSKKLADMQDGSGSAADREAQTQSIVHSAKLDAAKGFYDPECWKSPRS